MLLLPVQPEAVLLTKLTKTDLGRYVAMFRHFQKVEKRDLSGLQDNQKQIKIAFDY